ncbi:MAG: hypothetical protein H6721_14370 [Sandaracinus sp.]|nr:hypothetical protein [Sandaracinus sp.]MCB9621320.1 hypothetical protein [Sandaracinus sp.]MCB9621843.1 hypothetical protein [Sandaracinus sp.]MCB9633301.1 hypothetical protein [Sandaracinus sp.]
MTQDEVERAFAAWKGRYVWGVRVGAESLLSFEGGEPRLEVNEHHDVHGELRREVLPRGGHRFVVFDARFELGFHGETAATDEDGPGTLARAAAELSGQALERVGLEKGALRLEFDLGAQLRVWRHPQSEPGALVWQLVSEGMQLVFRA